MKIFLAGSGHVNMWLDENFTNFYRLESYHYISNQERKRVTEYKDFILDSGAFTYLNNTILTAVLLSLNLLNASAAKSQPKLVLLPFS